MERTGRKERVRSRPERKIGRAESARKSWKEDKHPAEGRWGQERMGPGGEKAAGQVWRERERPGANCGPRERG